MIGNSPSIRLSYCKLYLGDYSWWKKAKLYNLDGTTTKYYKQRLKNSEIGTKHCMWPQQLV